MALIQVNSTELRAQASKIRQYRRQHIQIMNRLKTLILSLNEDWKGEAQEAFVAKYQSMNVSFKDFDEMLDKYAKLMIKVADEMEQTDRELGSRIERIG